MTWVIKIIHIPCFEQFDVGAISVSTEQYLITAQKKARIYSWIVRYVNNNGVLH